jgi:hypothetical protein
MPFFRLAADLVPGKPIRMDGDRLNVVRLHFTAELKRGRDRGLRVVFGEEELQIRLCYFELAVRRSERSQFEVTYELAQSVRTFDGIVRAGHAFGCEERRENAVARSVRRSNTLPHRQVAATRRVERDVRCDGERHGLCELPHVEPE